MSEKRLMGIIKKVKEIEIADENEYYDEANELMYELFFNDLDWLIKEIIQHREALKRISVHSDDKIALFFAKRSLEGGK